MFNKEKEFEQIVGREMECLLSFSFMKVANSQFKILSEKSEDKKYTDEQIERIEKFCKGPVKSAIIHINHSNLNELIYESYDLKLIAKTIFDRNKTLNENIDEFSKLRNEIETEEFAWVNWGCYNNVENGRYDVFVQEHVEPIEWFEAFVEIGIIYFTQEN